MSRYPRDPFTLHTWGQDGQLLLGWLLVSIRDTTVLDRWAAWGEGQSSLKKQKAELFTLLLGNTTHALDLASQGTAASSMPLPEIYTALNVGLCQLACLLLPCPLAWATFASVLELLVFSCPLFPQFLGL